MAIKQNSMERLLRSTINSELSRAEGADQENIQANMKAALYAYEGEPALDPRDADVTYEATSTDVRDMTMAVVAQLTPMLSTECLVSFPPQGEADEEQARAESYAVDHIIMEKNKGYVEVQEAVKDALLLRNGAMKVHIDEEQQTRKIDLTLNGEPLTNPQIAALLEPRLPNETRTYEGEYIKVTTTKRKFYVTAVDYGNLLYEANADTSDIQKFRFFAERLYYTRSELTQMGYPKKTVDQLRPITDHETTINRSRNRSGQIANVAETKDQQVIECFEAYQLIDLDGDGISERYKVLIAGGNNGYVLDYEEHDLIPYAVGTAIIRPHRLNGESLYDHLWEIQQIKTDFLRQWLTNTRHLQGGRWSADPTKVNFDDLNSQSPTVRNRDPRTPPIALEIQDIGPSINLALQYMDKRRTEAGGAALDMVSADMQTFAETAHGIERQYSQKELLVSLYAMNLGETLIGPTYLLLHEMMRRYGNEPVELKMAGEWTKIDPRRWPKREAANVKAGKSAGERAHIQRTLQSLIQLQLAAMQQGLSGVLSDLSKLYNAVVDWITMAGLDSPDSYVINPNSEKAKQAQQIAQQQRQQAQQVQQSLIREQLKLEYSKLQQAAKEANDDLAYKYWSDRLKSETEEAKIVASGIIDLEKVQMEGERREQQANERAESSAASTG